MLRKIKRWRRRRVGGGNPAQCNGVRIRVSEETGGLTLDEVMAGRSGTLNLGGDVFIWEKGMDAPAEGDMVCKGSLGDDYAELGKAFRQAAKGHFLPCYLLMLDTPLPKEDEYEFVNQVRPYFNRILIPDAERENTPYTSFLRVLGYIDETV